MMNFIWVAFVVIAVIAAAFTGKMDAVLDNLFSFSSTAVDIAIGLIGIMAFFCGLMKVMEAAGLCDKLGKIISPLMRLLFPEVPADHPANSAMALYFAANILGIGNAATPFGLKAMQELQTLNKTKNVTCNCNDVNHSYSGNSNRSSCRSSIKGCSRDYCSGYNCNNYFDSYRYFLYHSFRKV